MSSDLRETTMCANGKVLTQWEDHRIPYDWSESSLSELSSEPITYGVVQPGKFDERGVLFIRGGDFANGEIDIGSLRTISNDVAAQYKRTKLTGGELIVSLVGYPGACAIVPDELVGANIARQVALLRPNSAISTSYLFQFIRSEIGQSRLKAHTVGSAQQVINLKDLKQVIVSIPPIDEQRRIADLLRSVDEVIKATEAELMGLRNISNALIDGHCRIAERSGSSSIGDFATFVGSGVTPKGGKDAYAEQGIAFIRSQNVHFDGLRSRGLAYIDAATDAKMARTRVQPDDVLLNITGASIGRCTVVPRDFGPANVNQHVCIIRPNPAVILPAYLSLFLSSHDGQRQIDQLQGGLSREGLNFQQVRAISVPNPTLEAQLEITETLGSLRSMIHAVERDLAAKETLRAGMSADLLSGRVRVPE